MESGEFQINAPELSNRWGSISTPSISADDDGFLYAYYYTSAESVATIFDLNTSETIGEISVSANSDPRVLALENGRFVAISYSIYDQNGFSMVADTNLHIIAPSLDENGVQRAGLERSHIWNKSDQYAADFVLEKIEPIHTYDINTQRGAEVAKLNSGSFVVA